MQTDHQGVKSIELGEIYLEPVMAQLESDQERIRDAISKSWEFSGVFKQYFGFFSGKEGSRRKSDSWNRQSSSRCTWNP